MRENSGTMGLAVSFRFIFVVMLRCKTL
jgi:hypothetical protein